MDRKDLRAFLVGAIITVSILVAMEVLGLLGYLLVLDWRVLSGG